MPLGFTKENRKFIGYRAEKYEKNPKSVKNIKNYMA